MLEPSTCKSVNVVLIRKLYDIIIMQGTFFSSTHFRLEALDPNAYAAFHASHNLQDVVERCLKKKDGPGLTRNLSIKTRVMTPVKPMLVSVSLLESIRRNPKLLHTSRPSKSLTLIDLWYQL